MFKKVGVCLLMAFWVASQSMAQTEKIFIEGFEENDATISGGSVVVSTPDEVANENVKPIEGSWAIYVEYDATSSNYWSQATVTLPVATDLTGITELHYSLYFLPDSTTNSNGQVPVRSHLPPDDGLSMDYITPGQWYDITMPIDPYTASSMSSFNLFRMVISAGVVGQGRFYLDNIYAIRPTNPAELEIVPVYGLNTTNPGETTPLGWMKDQASLPPTLGADFITPSEGSNCMLIPVTANYIRSVKTINAKADVDWTRVRALYFDVGVTSDFSTWGTIRPYLISTSGGTVVPVEYRGISDYKGKWRTVSFWLDLGPHMNSIIGDGDFEIGFLHDNGSAANTADGQNILIDNIRVGMVSSFCLATRSFVDAPSIFEGDSASFGVNVQLEMKGEATSVTLEETVPSGWTASDISNGGTVSNGVITWTVDVSPDSPVDVSYKVTSPAKITGKPVWSGTANGETVFGTESPLYYGSSVKASLVEVPFQTNTVTLDGIINEGEYTGANVYTFDHDTSKGNTAPGVHISGTSYPADKENLTFSVFHDSQYIYVAVDVVDPSLSFDYPDASFWNADSPELYFDGNMSRTNSIESNRYGCQLTVVGDGRLAASNNKYFPAMLDAVGGGKYMLDGRDGESDPIYWACGARVKDDNSGYIVEYRITKDQILDPVTRTEIGFDVMVNGSEASNPNVRSSKWGWHCTDTNGVVSEPYNNESGWTLMELQNNGTNVSEWNLF